MTNRTQQSIEPNNVEWPKPLRQHGFLRLKQIIGPDGPLPISRSGFWAGVKAKKFPQPLKISPRVTVWRAEDICELIAQLNRRGD